MTPKRFMVIAGEASGDILAAELVSAIREAMQGRSIRSPGAQPLEAGLAPVFFGAGGPRMAGAGVELAFDLTQESIIGLPGPRRFLRFRSRLNQLVALACERQPHAIICVDFALFNAVFAAAIKKHVRSRRGTFNNWEPKIVKYISPQVWASREYRVHKIARDFDLLLSIFPFEKDWYAARVPKFRVEFIGHPMIDRYTRPHSGRLAGKAPDKPSILLLPASRRAELRRHVPTMLAALALIHKQFPALTARMVLPTEQLVEMAKHRGVPEAGVELRLGGIAEALADADLVISKTGTVTMEAALFGVPSVTFYKASWFTYEVGKRIVKINSLTMPNLLAGEQIFPEFVQGDANPENLAKASLELLTNPARRQQVQAGLKKIVASLGGPGASGRAAEAVLKLIGC